MALLSIQSLQMVAQQKKSGRRGDVKSDISKVVSPMAVKKLEKHDDGIAAITDSSSYPSISSISDSSISRFQDQISHIATPVDLRPKVNSICRNDLRQISLIGSGRFCNVYLATLPSWLLSNSVSDKQGPRSLVAVKSIDSSKIKNTSEFALAAGDLANEAMILSELKHDNIVRLQGVCSESFSESFSDGGFFLVLEVLRDTLCGRLQKWRRQKHKKESLYRKAKGFGFTLLNLPKILPKPRQTSWKDASASTSATIFEPTSEERKRRMHNRIQETALGISSGLEYLHSNGIVLRDLKPENIGYENTSGVQYGSQSFNGCDIEVEHPGSSVRLLDFGMAKKVEMCIPHEICGSLRYMAPEVMIGNGYSLKVDVYSFGVVLFELCSLAHPFVMSPKKATKTRQKEILRNLSPWSSLQMPKGEENLVKSHYKQVIAGEVVLAGNLEKSVYCTELRALVKDCCDFDPMKRPDFSEIRSRLVSIFRNDEEL